MAKKKKWTINTYNAKIDRTKTVIWEGRNGILYEYLLPLAGNPMNFHEEAIDVRSHNKKTGRYQPIGDKSHFTFWQLRQIREARERNVR